LDTSQDILIQDNKINDKSSTNANTSKKSDDAVETGIFMSDSLNVQIDIITQIWHNRTFTEMDCNKSRKHDTYLNNSNNKINNMSKLKSEEIKESHNKNNVHSKIIINSPPKRKLQKGRKGSSNGDLDINGKYDDKISKQLNFDNLKII